jgi:hypothetical protein
MLVSDSETFALSNAELVSSVCFDSTMVASDYGIEHSVASGAVAIASAVARFWPVAALMIAVIVEMFGLD